MWEHSNDYMTQTLTRETPHGIFRAVLEHDEYGEAPDYDMGVPVFGYEFYGYEARLDDKPRIGSDSDDHSGIDFPTAVSRFYEQVGYFSDAIELTDRWLRIFHGGSVREINSHVWQGEPYYLAYDTKAMREHWGCTGELLATSDPSNAEWQAYIDGEVYVVKVEQAISFNEDGEPHGWDDIDGPVCGHYGEKWARDSAEEMLTWAIDSVSRGMLPMGETA